MHSAPDATLLGNLRKNSLVSLDLRSDELGERIVTLEGTAAVDSPSYRVKYGPEIQRLEMTPASFSRDFSIAVRIDVTRVRSWAPQGRL